MRQRDVGGVNLAQRAQLLGVHHAELLPAAHAHHGVTHGKLWTSAFNNLTDRAANHDLTERLGGGVAFGVVHATAHVRIET